MEDTTQAGETLRQKLIILKKRLTNFADDIKAVRDQGNAALKSDDAVDGFFGMYNSLDSIYQKFESIHFEMEELCIMNNSNVFPTTNDSNFLSTIKRYKNEASGIFVNLERKRKQQDTASYLSSDSSTNQTIVNLNRLTNLPDIKLPIFSGEITDWPFFRDSFLAAVHTKEQIPKIDKFTYLVGILKSPALDCIKAIPIAESNYDNAWDRLRQKYDNQRHLSSAYVHRFLNAKPIQKATADNLESLISKVLTSVDNFKLLAIKDREDYLLFEIIFRYLDQTTRQEFEQEHLNVDHPSYNQLKTFLENKLKQISRASLGCPSTFSPTDRSQPGFSKPNRYQPKPFNKTTNLLTTTATTDVSLKTFQCFICTQPHTIQKCPKFLKASSQQRLAMLNNYSGCKNCLCPKHHTRHCPSMFTCKYCKKRHHSLLHLPSSSANNPSLYPTKKLPTEDINITTTKLPTKDTGTDAVNFASIDISDTKVVLGTALAEIRDSSGNYHNIRLVLDSGSQHSYITTACAIRLGFSFHKTDCNISGLNNINGPTPEGIVYCTLKSRKSNVNFSTTALVVSAITSLLPQKPLPSLPVQTYSHLDLADPDFGIPGPVDFLLGADLFMQILRSSNKNEPPLLDTVFGLVVMGPLELPRENPICFLSIASLGEIVHRFWETEEVNRIIPISDEDQKCETFFRNTTYREASGRYVVALPFRSTKPDLKPITSNSLSRLYSLENKLNKNSKLKQQYCEFMHEYNNLGHMQLATSPSCYIIPHHAVYKKDSDKIRVVFDGSAKSSSGSLNDRLMAGPQLQKDIADVIIRFRRHPIVFTADIVKMYRQILVRPSDRTYQHILWRFSPDDSVDTYELNTITYGLTSSPYQAMRVIQQLVSDEGSDYPEASHVLINDIYVDDIVTGSIDLPSAIALKDQLKVLLSKGCFQLSKWASNSPDLISDEDQDTQQSINIVDITDTQASVKILGLQWTPISDCFTFTVNAPTISSHYTKRSILSTIARIYDPLGFLAPTIFLAKTILQQTWKNQYQWDEPLPQLILSKWLPLVQELPLLQQVKINRYLGNFQFYQPSYILGFCDASEAGYCASIYLHTGKRSNLIKAKTKLSPIKPVTIPRLELCAAVLLARLLDSIKAFLETLHNYEIYLFTDSMTVLAWLSTPPHTLKTFEAHRVVRILESTEIGWWAHVRSQDNPADCGSRGLFPAELLNYSLWWAGPSWISSPREQWPKCKDSYHHITTSYSDGIKTVTTSLIAVPVVNEFILWTERFSNYNRLIRSLAYVIRFARRKVLSYKTLELSALEIEMSLTKCISLIQHHYYPGAFKQPPNMSSQLLRLGIYQDDQGLLRVGGRLEHSPLPYDQKHPILLPRDAHLSVLIVRYYHRTSLHIGCGALKAIIQRKFWIISLRNLCRKIKMQCLICKRSSKSSSHPYMGDLPSIRFTEINAFHITAVDFAGPFLSRETPRRKAPIIKVYMCLFICLSTKAIHLELAHALSTEAFIDALERFVARRGRPSKFISDCGTNFVGTAHFYHELCDWLQNKDTQDKMINHSTSLGVAWDFNPPRSPHFGGLFEAGVKSAKTLLSKYMGNSNLTVAELSNAFTKVEAMLNSRPLYPVSDDPDDCQPLTPGHFLIGGPLNALPEQPVTDVPYSSLSRWQVVRERTQTFWQQWRDQYLSHLMIRKKWYKHCPNFKIGDIALLKETSSTPYAWPYAKIMDIHPGEDGIVRVVTIKTKGGIYKRSVGNLISLQPILEA